jgi:hypothetical protein
MSGPHNALFETHWTNSEDENLLIKHLIHRDKEKMYPLPAKKNGISQGFYSLASERNDSVPAVTTMWRISKKLIRKVSLK